MTLEAINLKVFIGHIGSIVKSTKKLHYPLPLHPLQENAPRFSLMEGIRRDTLE
jgi:hypothetical protein